MPLLWLPYIGLSPLSFEKILFPAIFEEASGHVRKLIQQKVRDSFQLIASKKLKPSVLQSQGTKFCQNHIS